MPSPPPLLLIVNPAAQRVSARRIRRITEALEGAYRLDVVQTKERGHAQEIAARAGSEGFVAVAVLGGDGTLNEAINGLAGTPLPVTVLPAGGANVFARSLGIPRDGVDAARRLAGGAATSRQIPLGRSDGRWFSANLGVGFDAAIVRHVEARPRIKRLVGDAYFVWAGIRVYASGYDRRSPALRMRWEADPATPSEAGGLFMAVVQNLDPYTFLGPRPLRLCPAASVEDELDAFAIHSLRLRTVLRVLGSAFGPARHSRHPSVTSVRGGSRYEFACDRPLPVQMDGEYIGERTRLVVESVPNALAVLA